MSVHKPPLVRMVERARIVLLSADGVTGREIGARVGCSEQTVVAWRARYTIEGLAGLDDRPRCGRPRKIDAGFTVTDPGGYVEAPA